MRKPRVLRGPLAERLEREHAEQIVSRMRKALRKGKVLIDWSQNDEHKTPSMSTRSEQGSNQRSRLQSRGRK
jgi:DNA primase